MGSRRRVGPEPLAGARVPWACAAQRRDAAASGCALPHRRPRALVQRERDPRCGHPSVDAGSARWTHPPARGRDALRRADRYGHGCGAARDSPPGPARDRADVAALAACARGGRTHRGARCQRGAGSAGGICAPRRERFPTRARVRDDQRPGRRSRRADARLARAALDRPSRRPQREVVRRRRVGQPRRRHVRAVR